MRTITELLSKLKMLGKRQTTQPEIVNMVVPKSQWTDAHEKAERANMAELRSLLALNDEEVTARVALFKANMQTAVNIPGRPQMTVAEALIRRAQIQPLRELLNKYLQAANRRDDAIAKARAALSNQVADLASKGLDEASQRQFIEANEPKPTISDTLVMNVKSMLKQLDEFDTSVDVALSIANATTTVDA